MKILSENKKMKTEKMKIIGRRKYNLRGKDSLKEVDKLQRLAMRLRKGKPFFPPGVYCFKSFEEEDLWRMKILTGKKPEFPQ
jgi:hypothetical protein